MRDAGELGEDCEPCSLSVQFIPVSSAGSWRASSWGPYPKRGESRDLNSKEDVSGSTCWQLEQRFAHVLSAVGDLSWAGGQVEVVVCAAAVQGLDWWKL